MWVRLPCCPEGSSTMYRRNTDSVGSLSPSSPTLVQPQAPQSLCPISLLSPPVSTSRIFVVPIKKPSSHLWTWTLILTASKIPATLVVSLPSWDFQAIGPRPGFTDENKPGQKTGYGVVLQAQPSFSSSSGIKWYLKYYFFFILMLFINTESNISASCLCQLCVMLLFCPLQRKVINIWLLTVLVESLKLFCHNIGHVAAVMCVWSFVYSFVYRSSVFLKEKT